MKVISASFTQCVSAGTLPVGNLSLTLLAAPFGLLHINLLVYSSKDHLVDKRQLIIIDI